MYDRYAYDPRDRDDRDDHPIGAGHADGIRAADADREATAELLRTHHAAGRLSDDEFQQRLEQSMAARTLGELRALVADLPGQHQPRTERTRSGRAHRAAMHRWHGRPRGPFGLRLLPLVLVLALLWSALAGHGAWHHGYGVHHHGPWFPWPLLLIAVAAFAFMRRGSRHAFGRRLL